MTTTYKVLGQLDPAAATLTELYAAPSATQALLSTLFIANRSATPTTFRVSVQVANAADANKQYLAYDVPIAGNAVLPFAIGVTLAATDTINVYANDATLSFNLFGAEIT